MHSCYICYLMLHQNVTRQSLNWINFNIVYEKMLHKSEDILRVKLLSSESSRRFSLEGLPREKM